MRDLIIQKILEIPERFFYMKKPSPLELANMDGEELLTEYTCAMLNERDEDWK